MEASSSGRLLTFKIGPSQELSYYKDNKLIEQKYRMVKRNETARFNFDHLLDFREVIYKTHIDKRVVIQDGDVERTSADEILIVDFGGILESISDDWLLSEVLPEDWSTSEKSFIIKYINDAVNKANRRPSESAKLKSNFKKQLATMRNLRFLDEFAKKNTKSQSASAIRNDAMWLIREELIMRVFINLTEGIIDSEYKNRIVGMDFTGVSISHQLMRVIARTYWKMRGHIKILNFQNTGIDGKSLNMIFRRLMSNESEIYILNLSANGEMRDNMAEIGTFFSMNPKVCALVLETINMSDGQLRHFLSGIESATTENTHLQNFFVGRCNLASEDGVTIGLLLRRLNIRLLNISNNRIMEDRNGDVSTHGMRNVLESSKYVERLDISYLRLFDNNQMTALIDSLSTLLTDNKHTNEIKMETIHQLTTANPAPFDFEKHVEKEISRFLRFISHSSNRLEILHITHNGIDIYGPEFYPAMMDLIRHNTVLRCMYFYGNDHSRMFSYQNMMYVRQIAFFNRSLIVFNFEGDPMMERELHEDAFFIVSADRFYLGSSQRVGVNKKRAFNIYRLKLLFLIRNRLELPQGPRELSGHLFVDTKVNLFTREDAKEYEDVNGVSAFEYDFTDIFLDDDILEEIFRSMPYSFVEPVTIKLKQMEDVQVFLARSGLTYPHNAPLTGRWVKTCVEECKRRMIHRKIDTLFLSKMGLSDINIRNIIGAVYKRSSTQNKIRALSIVGNPTYSEGLTAIANLIRATEVEDISVNIGNHVPKKGKLSEAGALELFDAISVDYDLRDLTIDGDRCFRNTRIAHGFSRAMENSLSIVMLTIWNVRIDETNIDDVLSFLATTTQLKSLLLMNNGIEDLGYLGEVLMTNHSLKTLIVSNISEDPQQVILHGYSDVFYFADMINAHNDTLETISIRPLSPEDEEDLFAYMAASRDRNRKRNKNLEKENKEERDTPVEIHPEKPSEYPLWPHAYNVDDILAEENRPQSSMGIIYEDDQYAFDVVVENAPQSSFGVSHQHEQGAYNLGPYVSNRRRGEAKFQIYDPNDKSRKRENFRYVQNRTADRLYRIQQNDPTLKEVSFKNESTIVTIAKKIDRFLKGTDNTHLRVLDLSMAALFMYEERFPIFFAFGRLIVEGKLRIEELDLSWSGKIRHEPVLDMLCEIINKSKTIERLFLKNCGLVIDTNYNKFIDAIAKNTTLKVLDMSNFDEPLVDRKFIGSLIRALSKGTPYDDGTPRPRVIEELNISIGYLQMNDHLFRELGVLITEVPTFTSLIWTGDALTVVETHEHFDLFLEPLRKTQYLETFHLPSIASSSTKAVLVNIFKAIIENEHKPFTEIVCTSPTKVSSVPLNLLLSGIANPPAGPNFYRLQILSLERVYFDNKSPQAFRSMITQITTLEQLLITTGQTYMGIADDDKLTINGEVIDAIIEGLEASPHDNFKILELNRFEIFPQPMTNLFTYMQKNKTIVHLLLMYTGMTLHGNQPEWDDLMYAVVGFLAKNTTVTFIDISKNAYIGTFINYFIGGMRETNRTITQVIYSRDFDNVPQNEIRFHEAELAKQLTVIRMITDRNRQHAKTTDIRLGNLLVDFYEEKLKTDIIESYPFIPPTDIVSLSTMNAEVVAENAILVVHIDKLKHFLDMKLWTKEKKNDGILPGDFSPNEVLHAIENKTTVNTEPYGVYYLLLDEGLRWGMAEHKHGRYGTVFEWIGATSPIIVRWPIDCDLPIYIYSGMYELALSAKAGANLVNIFIVSETQLKKHSVQKSEFFEEMTTPSSFSLVPTSSSMTEEEHEAKRHRANTRFRLTERDIERNPETYQYTPERTMDKIYRIRANNPNLHTANFAMSSTLTDMPAFSLSTELRGTHNTYLQVLDLSHIKLFLPTFGFIFQNFKTLIVDGDLQIKTLILNDCGVIGDYYERMQDDLAELIKTPTTIEELLLGNCGIRGERGAMKFVEALAENRTIKRLSLLGFVVDVGIWRGILNAIYHAGIIEALVIARVKQFMNETMDGLPSEAMEPLFRLMTETPTLTRLNLAHSIRMMNDGDMPEVHWFVHGLATTTTIKDLNFSGCIFTRNASTDVVDAIERNPMKPFTHLSVNDLALSAVLSNRLIKALNTPRQGNVRGFILTHFYFGGNYLNPESGKLLKEFLSNPSMPLQEFSVSQYPLFGEARVDNVIVSRIISGLQKNTNTKLKFLLIDKFDVIDNVTYQKLFTFLRDNKTIEKFLFAGKTDGLLNGPASGIFVDVISNNKTLKTIVIKRANFSVDVGLRIAEEVQNRNYTLTKLELSIAIPEDADEIQLEEARLKVEFFKHVINTAIKRNKDNEAKKGSLKSLILPAANRQLAAITLLEKYPPVVIANLGGLIDTVKRDNRMMPIMLNKLDPLLDVTLIGGLGKPMTLKQAITAIKSGEDDLFKNLIEDTFKRAHSLEERYGKQGKVFVASDYMSFQPVIVRWPTERIYPIAILSGANQLIVSSVYGADIIELYIASEEQIQSFSLQPSTINLDPESSSGGPSSSSSYERSSEMKRQRTGGKKKDLVI